MTGTTLRAAASFAAAAALALSACGGGGSGSSDKISADPSSPPANTSVTPSPSASASAPGVARPKITLPKGLVDTFVGWRTGDPAKDAVLADNQQHVLAVDQAVVLGRTNTPALRFYTTGDALLASATFIARTLNRGVTFTGTVRYFNPRLTFFNDSSAGLGYCADETKGFTKDRKTGRVSGGGSTTDPQSYVSYTARLTKDTRGVWQTASVTSTRGGKPCVP